MKTEILLVERDRANEGLREAEQRFKRLLDAITDYTYTVDLDNGQTTRTAYGQGCEGVTGYSPADYRNDPYLWYKIIHEKDRTAVLKQIDLILQGELPPPLEHRIIHRNGTIRWIRNTTIPHHDEAGKLIGYEGLIADITERKRWEEVLERERNLLRTLVDNLPDYIFVKDTASRFILDNVAHAQALGAGSVAEVLGKTDTDFLTPAQAAQNRRAEENVIRAGQPQYNVEESSVDSEGNRRWFSVTRVPLRNSQGTVTGLVGIKHDITNLKLAEQCVHKAQDQLIQAARFESIGALASGVAHEVKNPLQTMLMGISFLARKLNSTEESVLQSLQDMEESVSRANSIIGDLLALARVGDFQLKDGNLNPVIQKSLHLTKAQLDAARVSTVLNLEPDLPVLRVNEIKMEQVFLNLFFNAIQAMPSGGTLTVTTRTVVLDENLHSKGLVFRKFQPHDRLVLAEVKDTGVGIPESFLRKLFQPFSTTKPTGVGNGLGLFVASLIIEGHGGAITLENAPGGGALASIVLKPEPESCS
jgi:PAS domain S-box-containing protein